jgi:hypothetical protein
MIIIDISLCDFDVVLWIWIKSFVSSSSLMVVSNYLVDCTIQLYHVDLQ